jgi:hypothetical protein
MYLFVLHKEQNFWFTLSMKYKEKNSSYTIFETNKQYLYQVPFLSLTAKNSMGHEIVNFIARTTNFSLLHNSPGTSCFKSVLYCTLLPVGMLAPVFLGIQSEQLNMEHWGPWSSEDLLGFMPQQSCMHLSKTFAQCSTWLYPRAGAMAPGNPATTHLRSTSAQCWIPATLSPFL